MCRRAFSEPLSQRTADTLPHRILPRGRLCYFSRLTNSPTNRFPTTLEFARLWRKTMTSFLYFDRAASYPEPSHLHEQMGRVLEGTFELISRGKSNNCKIKMLTSVLPVQSTAQSFAQPTIAFDILSPRQKCINYK